MAASRLECWANILPAYNYEVKYWPTNKHGNVDALSKLPFDYDAHCTDDEVNDTICLLEQQQQQANHLPIKADDIQPLMAQFHPKFTTLRFMDGQHQ